MYKQWGRTLDAVIQLDTPVPVLLNRIRARERQYEVEKMSDEEALKYLASIRAAQECVLATLTAGSQRSRILSFNTVEASPEQICDEVLSTLGLERGKHYVVPC
jgi:deoxyadenosine/deoxycytidine kinase